MTLFLLVVNTIPFLPFPKSTPILFPTVIQQLRRPKIKS